MSKCQQQFNKKLNNYLTANKDQIIIQMNNNNKSKSKHYHHANTQTSSNDTLAIKNNPNANLNINIMHNKQNILTSSIGGSDSTNPICVIPNLSPNTISNMTKNIKVKHSSQRDIVKCTSNHQNVMSRDNNNHNSHFYTSKSNHNQNIISHAHLQNVSSNTKNHIPIKAPTYASRYMARSESKRNIIAKGLRDCDSINKQNREKEKDKQNRVNFQAKQVKEKSLKLPKIIKQDIQIQKQRHCRSVKKIHTEPPEMHSTDSQNQVSMAVNVNTNSNTNILKTMSPKQNMKQVLLNIVKERENRHLVSIDDEIQRLELLTKRYSCLRKDLVSIQEDILTIGFKQKIKEKGKESQSNSVVFL